jgi:hypothetical protein
MDRARRNDVPGAIRPPQALARSPLGEKLTEASGRHPVIATVARPAENLFLLPSHWRIEPAQPCGRLSL